MVSRFSFLGLILGLLLDADARFGGRRNPTIGRVLDRAMSFVELLQDLVPMRGPTLLEQIEEDRLAGHDYFYRDPAGSPIVEIDLVEIDSEEGQQILRAL